MFFFCYSFVFCHFYEQKESVPFLPFLQFYPFLFRLVTAVANDVQEFNRGHLVHRIPIRPDGLCNAVYICNPSPTVLES